MVIAEGYSMLNLHARSISTVISRLKCVENGGTHSFEFISREPDPVIRVRHRFLCCSTQLLKL